MKVCSVCVYSYGIIGSVHVLHCVAACQQMVRRITQLVFDSFGDQFYSKALECMHALREAAVKVSTESLTDQMLLLFCCCFVVVLLLLFCCCFVVIILLLLFVVA